VLVGDGHSPVRAGIARALGDAHVVCAEVATAQEAVDRARAEAPDVCILGFAVRESVRAAREIAARRPSPRIVILSDSESDDDFLAAVRAGATAYLPKEAEPIELRMAVERVLRGEAALPGRLAMRLIEEFRAPGRTRMRLEGRREVDLTRREGEILALMRAGKSTSEIAYLLSISPVTVRRHVSAIVKKLEATGRDEAVEVAAAAFND
jgi:two-component system, NarL family, nitrate/nitrite response regulator NarL